MKKKLLAILGTIVALTTFGACDLQSDESSSTLDSSVQSSTGSPEESSSETNSSDTHVHSWSGDWSYNENEHYHACTVDGCTETNGNAAHSGGVATLTERAVCSICNNEYGDLVTAAWDLSVYDEEICINTPATLPMIALTYAGQSIGADDITMSVKFEGESINLSDYSNGAPTTGTVELTWSYLDANKTIEIEVIDHASNQDDGNCTTAITCANCSTELVAAKSHVSTAGWEKDALSHWHVCENDNCGKAFDLASHSGGTATCTEKGACADCGYAYLSATGHTFDGFACTAGDCNVMEKVFGSSNVTITATQGSVAPAQDGSIAFSSDWWVNTTITGLTIPANATQIKLTMKTDGSTFEDGGVWHNITGTTATASVEAAHAVTDEYAVYTIDLTSSQGADLTNLNLTVQNHTVYLSKVEFTLVELSDVVEAVFGEGVVLTATQGTVTAQEGALAFVNPDWWVKTTLTDFAIPANATQMILTMKSTGAVSGVKYNNIAGATGNNATEFALTSEYAEYVIDLESGAAGTEITAFEICTCGWPIYISKVEFSDDSIVDNSLNEAVTNVFGEGVALTTTQGTVTAQEGALAFVNPDWWVKTTVTGLTIPANATQMILTMKSTGAVSGVKYNNIAGATGNNATEFALTSEYAEYVITLENGAAGTEITAFEICTCGWPIYISNVQFVVV